MLNFATFFVNLNQEMLLFDNQDKNSTFGQTSDAKQNASRNKNFFVPPRQANPESLLATYKFYDNILDQNKNFNLIDRNTKKSP